MCNLECMNEDLQRDIMGRLNGLALASLACTCPHLRDTTKDQSLWKRLCHSRWPSTALKQAPITDAFHHFYEDAYPLILYDNAAKPPNCPKGKTCLSSSDFVSLVDIYYKNKSIFCRILDGTHGVSGSLEQESIIDSSWDPSDPFTLKVLDIDDEDCCGGSVFPSCSFSKNENSIEDHCEKLMEDLTLSWVLMDKKAGNAANLSSWKPLSVKRNWPYHQQYLIHFGCVIPVEESVLPNKLARCVITAKLRVSEMEGCLTWSGISMHIEDIKGAHVDGRISLMVLNQALYSLRSSNHLKVRKGVLQYEKQKREMMGRRKCGETLADVAVSIVFLIWFYFTISSYL